MKMRLCLTATVFILLSAAGASAGDDPSFEKFLEKTRESETLEAEEFERVYAALENGSGELPLSDKRILELMLPRAEAGDPRAQTLVGMVYSRGLEIPADSAKAIHWLTPAAESGNEQAMFILGGEYLKQYIADGSREAAEQGAKYMQPLADKGNREAELIVGRLYYDFEEYEKALPYLEVTATAGDSESQLNLGLMYLLGQGVLQDNAKALTLLLEYLMTNENLDVQCIVAGLYYELGNEDNYKKAYEYYSHSANNGNVNGYVGLGVMYLFGRHIKTDYTKAGKYLDMGVEADLPWAIYVRGYMFECGKGEKINLDKAIALYERAAELGHVSAQQQLDVIKKSKTKVNAQ